MEIIIKITTRKYHLLQYHYSMTVARFDLLLQKLALRLRKKSTNFRQPISPEQMLVLTLRYDFPFCTTVLL